MRADLPADLAELVSRPPVYRLLGVGEKVHGKHPARVKVLVASVMQPKAV